MVCIVAASKAQDVKSQLEGQGEKVYTIGKLVERNSAPNDGDEGCILTGLEAWDRL